MKQNSDYLFVYGTLLGSDNEFAIYLKQYCTFYKPGKFKGKLYDLGEYPGAVHDDNNGYVYGSIFQLLNQAEAFEYLDDYEGFGDDQDQPNLFIRKFISIETDNEQINCWGYLYNLSVAGFRLIESGDYLQYKILN